MAGKWRTWIFSWIQLYFFSPQLETIGPGPIWRLRGLVGSRRGVPWMTVLWLTGCINILLLNDCRLCMIMLRSLNFLGCCFSSEPDCVDISWHFNSSRRMALFWDESMSAAWEVNFTVALCRFGRSQLHHLPQLSERVSRVGWWMNSSGQELFLFIFSDFGELQSNFLVKFPQS